MRTLVQDLRYGALMLLMALTLSLAARAQSAPRLFQPEDLFRVWQVGKGHQLAMAAATIAAMVRSS